MDKATASSCPDVALAAALLASLCAGDAAAYNDDAAAPQTTDRTAYVVPKGMHKIGLFSVEYGIADGLQMITWPFWWHVLAPSGGLEWRFINTPIYAMSLSATGLYVSSRPLQLIFDTLPTADLGIIPADLIGTWRLGEDWTLSFGNELTTVILSGDYDEDAFQGTAAVTNLQSHATVEWRVSRVVALQIHGRYLVFQTVRANTQVTVEPDDFTTITAAAAGKTDALDFPHAYQIVPGVHLSWETFNLTAGLGYGNFVIPAVNFVLPNRGVVPRLDIYWRF